MAVHSSKPLVVEKVCPPKNILVDALIEMTIALGQRQDVCPMKRNIKSKPHLFKGTRRNDMLFPDQRLVRPFSCSGEQVS